ncbi:hypothetical protein QT711_03180 [Sporosarcina saromensis]|uniref:Uncharacterized protein n=1 Tax=Sporosarcina saromensis TaxID=359365 RepID=A0ABU4G5D5_9BACL|nr:hypothetical protein [Sporosarcina saromensis]MDW0112173.1 hypothetical protein [Sporosarcina saromensis]
MHEEKIKIEMEKMKMKEMYEMIEQQKAHLNGLVERINELEANYQQWLAYTNIWTKYAELAELVDDYYEKYEVVPEDEDEVELDEIDQYLIRQIEKFCY